MTHDETELLTRVGPGTPMGELMRRYWLPACLTEEIAEPDCDPIRVRLLGEDLVAYRDSAGRAGLLAEYCAHRGASLVLGRNEDGGLRCLYHGWKYDVDGRVLDTPCEPAESTFKDRLRHVAYPTLEQGDIVWTYMGPIDHKPDFPNFEWTLLPSQRRSIAKVREECNYLQSVEGGLDSSHADILHSGWAIMGTWENDVWQRPSRDTAPIIEVEDTPYGFRYAAMRTHKERPDELKYVRITQFAMPFHCLFGGMAHLFVPIDDGHTWNYNAFVSRTDPIDHEAHLARRNQRIGIEINPDRTRVQTLANNFLQDRAAMRAKKSFSGIVGSGPNQDMAVLESMGPIYDRTQEHLGSSDIAVVHLRQVMLKAARAFIESGEAKGVDPEIPYDRIHAESAVLPIAAAWRTEIGCYA